MRKLLIVAGESSGDLHGAALASALLELEPHLKITALGGPLMQQAGAELLADLTAHAVVGLFEGMRNLSRIYSTYRSVIQHMKTNRPDAVVLIDYPEFNLRLARRAGKLGIPVIYYISPQVWAWRQWRVKLVQRYVDRMLVIFPFEEEFYRRHGVDRVEFVGHPLLDTLATVPDRQMARADLGLGENETVIGLLPGSRKKEFESLFPILAESARIIKENLGRPVTFLCAKAPSLDDSLAERYLAGTDLDIRMVSGDTYRVMRSSDLLLAASGTATVEAMVLGTPMIVVYRVSILTWILFIRLMKVSRYAMVNIVAGDEIVPEFIQWNATPDRIAREALAMFQGDRLQQVSDNLARATALLGRPHSSRGGTVPSIVAARIQEFLGSAK
ncbi:MAG TPA: lipid-A-disaccharide synthase [Planctomycetota bacterium]|nr:lipid-A-disaccharide synthase [Planctomycetota bacterium]